MALRERESKGATSADVTSPVERPGHVDRRLGVVVAGKYRVARLLGAGGMARVYEAEELATGRRVAVKFLRAELADDPVTLARFAREAQAAGCVGSAHVVEVLAVGAEPDDAPFLVLECVPGRSLHELLEAEGALPVPRACGIACQILEALVAVHRCGIVHRDLKPENVLLTTQRGLDDYVKLCDFGIATYAAAQARAELTPVGRTMASPHYASPEQLAGASGRDERVDLYAVGVILFELLAGRRPFDAATTAELFEKILREAPPPLRVFRRDVPEALEAVLARALAKTPELRQATAAALLAELRPFCGAREDASSAADRALGAPPHASGPCCAVAPAGLDYIAVAVARSLVEFLREQLPHGVLLEALRSLEPLDRELVAGALPSDGWVPARGFAELLDAAERLAGTPERLLAARAGRHGARRLLADRPDLARPDASAPERFFAELPGVWRATHGSGEARVTRCALGQGTVEIVGQAAPRVARTVAAASFLEEALRLLGAESVVVLLARAEALGDDRDALEASWSRVARPASTLAR